MEYKSLEKKINPMQRDISIDILKFFAAIIITWSHMEKPLGDYSMLATGGTFGDVLFFFCSGYTLFLGKDAGFFNWYKKRINRIYPTVFSWGLICALLFNNNDNILQIILNGGGWFISCIMIYYVFLWFIKRYLINKMEYVLCITITLIIGWYFIVCKDHDGYSMYGETYFKWCHYFLFMLLGSIWGLKYKKGELKNNSNFVMPVIYTFVCIVLFYLFFSFYKKSGLLNALQLLSLIPLAGVCIFTYKVCNSNFIVNIYNSKYFGIIMKFIGGLCLEIYLVQTPILTDKLNYIFPLNILIIYITIILGAYLLRCISRIWSQTFKDGDYDIKSIVKL